MWTKYWLESLKEEATRKPRRRWDDNIKMHVREILFGGVDWIHVVQDRDSDCIQLNERMVGDR
jgi:hypothetical protein